MYACSWIGISITANEDPYPITATVPRNTCRWPLQSRHENNHL